jgi:hypothetical protein
MKIDLPDINQVMRAILPVKSKFDVNIKPIGEWISEHREEIENNKKLINTHANDMKIIIKLLNELLMRSMRGERGSKIKTALNKNLKSKDDLNGIVYKMVLSDAQYRFPNEGHEVMTAVVSYFRDDLKWNFRNYFEMADRHSETNFTQDFLLTVKGIKFKVRDLALSVFNENYVANDLHVVRVSTRLGLLNYGFEFLPDIAFEMGNNPSDQKNYLFLHRLFLRLSEMTDNKWHLGDFDRAFWHFGRTVCNDRPSCNSCPLSKMCLTGKS